MQAEVRGQKAESDAGDSALTPLAPAMLAVGVKLAEPFSTADLAEASGSTKKQASNAITRWLINKLIKRVEFGKYRRLAKFPGARSVEREVVVTKEKVADLGEVTMMQSNPPAPVKAKSVEQGSTADSRASQQQRPTVESEEKLTPYSARGITLGRSLKSTFTMPELAALLPQGLPSAYYFVAQWKAKSWIRKEDYDVYRKEPNFGQ